MQFMYVACTTEQKRTQGLIYLLLSFQVDKLSFLMKKKKNKKLVTITRTKLRTPFFFFTPVLSILYL